MHPFDADMDGVFTIDNILVFVPSESDLDGDGRPDHATFLSARRTDVSDQLSLTFVAQSRCSAYELLECDDLVAPIWMVIATRPATGSSGFFLRHHASPGRTERFYRVRCVP